MRKNGNGLTANQQVFCDEYLKDRNATRAYRVAYPRVKSDKTAGSLAPRLMGNDRVSAYIAAQEARMHRASIADATEVREFLTAVMRGDETEEVPLYMPHGGQELLNAQPGMTVRVRAAELLGKLMGMFTDNVSVSVQRMPKITICEDGSAWSEDDDDA